MSCSVIYVYYICDFKRTMTYFFSGSTPHEKNIYNETKLTNGPKFSFAFDKPQSPELMKITRA